MAFSDVELALRKELLKAVAERDRTSTELKVEIAKHERVHTLCADAINDLTNKNAALEALARQMKATLLECVVLTHSPEDELSPVELLVKQRYEETIAACEKLGIKDAPKELNS